MSETTIETPVQAPAESPHVRLALAAHLIDLAESANDPTAETTMRIDAVEKAILAIQEGVGKLTSQHSALARKLFVGRMKEDSNQLVRWYSLLGLQVLAGRVAVGETWIPFIQACRIALSDSYPLIRNSAVLWLSGFRHESVVAHAAAVVKEALTDTDLLIRLTAINVLGHFGEAARDVVSRQELIEAAAGGGNDLLKETVRAAIASISGEYPRAHRRMRRDD